MSYPKRNSFFTLISFLTLLSVSTIVKAQGYWGAVDLNRSEDLYDVYFRDDDHGWIVGQNGLILYTETGGDSPSDWHTAVVNPSTEDLHKVFFIDNFRGWAVGANGVVLNTNDGGVTWSNVYSIATANTISSIFFIGSQTGWTTSESNLTSAYRTSNGGADWDSILSLDGLGRDVVFSDGANGWLVCVDGMSPGTVFGSSTGGVNWVELVSSSSRLYAVALDGSSQVWVVGEGGQMRRSGDGWQLANVGSKDFMDITFVPDSTDIAWVVGESGTIYQTSDGGSQWNDQSFGSQDLMAVSASSPSRAWAIGLNGTFLVFRECIDDSHCSGLLQGCVDRGRCDAGTHTCGVVLANGTDCDDGLYCTDGDHCQGGTCQGGQPRDCSGMSDACNTGGCDEQADACVAQALANGTDCDDGLYCTDGDHCEQGLCIGSAETDCSYLNDPPCFVGWCDPDANTCSAVADTGAGCDDGLICTKDDSCDAQGHCSGVAVSCVACQVCAESSGGCVANSQAQGMECDDKQGCHGVCDGRGICMVEAWCENSIDGCEDLEPLKYSQDGTCRLGEDYMSLDVSSPGFIKQGRFTPIKVEIPVADDLTELDEVLFRITPCLSVSNRPRKDGLVLQSASVLGPNLDITQGISPDGGSVLLHITRRVDSENAVSARLEPLGVQLLVNGEGNLNTCFRLDAWAPCSSSHEEPGCHWDNSPEGVDDMPPVLLGQRGGFSTGFQKLTQTGTWDLSGRAVKDPNPIDDRFVGCACDSSESDFSDLFYLLVLLTFWSTGRRYS